jgi:MIP family channel proteins
MGEWGDRVEDKSVDSQKNIVQAAASEFIAVFIFVFSGCCAAISNKELFAVAMAFGLGIMVMASVFGAVSGGHINPAVSVGFFVTGFISLYRLVVYVIAQLLGGILGAICVKVVTNDKTHLLGANTLGHGVHAWEAFGIEIITTFALVFVIFCTAVDPYPNLSRQAYAFIPIGFTVVMGILATGNISGGSMNPARSFGPAVAANHYNDVWVYILGPLLGGALGGLTHRFGFLPRNPDAVYCMEKASMAADGYMNSAA